MGVKEMRSRAREILSYGTAALAAAAALGFAGLVGNRIEYQLHTRPLQEQAYRLEQGRKETAGRLERYTARLADGRMATLNPDMSVTVSGIDGVERSIDVCPQEFRTLRKN